MAVVGLSCMQKKSQNCKSNQNEIESIFTWHLKNFEMCPDQWGKPLKSPEFGFYNWQDPKFCILLYTGGVNEKSSKYLSAYLVKTGFGEENFIYSCELGIVTGEGAKKCFGFSNTKLIRGHGKGRARFFEKEKFLSAEKVIYLPGGCLSIYCKMKVRTISLIYDFDLTLRELSDIYEKIYRVEKHCDLFLYVGENTFKVHKVVLNARFPSLLKNVDGDKCHIKDIGSKTMNALLRYIYTGFLNIDEINIFEVLSSDYELPLHLKNLLLENQNKTVVTTCFQETVIHFSWNIKKFNFLDSNKIIHYPLIGDHNMKWTWLDLFLCVATDNDYITISMQRFSKDCKRILCTIKISDVTKTFSHTYNKIDLWTLPQFFTKDMLKNEYPDSTSDEIKLDFKIALSDGSKTDEYGKKEIILNSHLINKTASDLVSFNRHLLNILKEPNFCDITIVSGENKFPAHKFILSARSPVFRYMLETYSEIAKRRNSEITIDYLDSAVIKDMLAYIYCSEVEFTLYEIKHIHGLYVAACRYNLPGLMTECVNYLKINLNAETAGDILLSADEWNDEEMKEIVYNYVCSHPLQIASSSEWEHVMLRRSDLASEVLKMTLKYFAGGNKVISRETS